MRLPRHIACAIPPDTWLTVFPGAFVLGLNCAILHHDISLDQILIGADASSLLLLNTILGGCALLLRWHAVLPWRKLVRQLEYARHEMGGTQGKEPVAASLGGIAHEISKLTALARESYQRHRETLHELESTKRAVAEYRQAQQAIIGHTSREISSQYQSVLAYANYLEEQVVHKKSATEQRYDFDDVCESSFNLRLIAGAIDLLQRGAPEALRPTLLGGLMQQMLFSLVPSLERRSMKLSTAGFDMDVCATTHAETLSCVLWMILLGIVRYAEAESTLHIRSRHDRRRHKAILSIVVSELAPGRLTPTERGHYLARQSEHIHSHMFTETIRIHANIQLAEMLLKSLEGGVRVLPRGSHACEIRLILPASPSI